MGNQASGRTQLTAVDNELMASAGSLPPLQTLNDLLFGIARRGSAEVLRCKREGVWTPMAGHDVYRVVVHLASVLKRLGIRPGDRVVLLSENRPEWTLADLAILACGAVTVPLYPTLTSGVCEFILQECGARLLFVSKTEHLDKICGCWPRLPELAKVVLFDGDPPASLDTARVLKWEDVAGQPQTEPGPVAPGLVPGMPGARPGATAREAAADFEAVARSISPDDLASIVYTSGTTGTPKGVMLTHHNIVSNVLAVPTEFFLPGDVALSFLPLSHVYERMVVYTFLYYGIPVVFAESVEAVPQNLIEVRPTLATAVPRFFEKLYTRVLENLQRASWPRRKLFWWAVRVGRKALQCRIAARPVPLTLKWRHRLAGRLVFRRLRERLGGRIRCFISGGGPLSPQLAEFFNAVDIMVCEGYGLTETSPVVTCNVPSRPRPGTAGRPLAGVEVRIAEDGEILVRGPNVMKGYYNRPEETAQVIEDGWLHTGDIGEFTEEGDLRVTDRKKDLLKTAGGKFVAPQPIENSLRASPYISNAVVVGDRCRYVAALLVPNFERLAEFARGCGLDGISRAELLRNEEVRALLQGQVDEVNAVLAQFEQIKRFALLENDFSIRSGELTPTLKVKRRLIEGQYRELIASLYS